MSLKRSIHEWVGISEIKQLIETKNKIREIQSEWWKVAVLLVTGDLTNAAHVQYINTAKKAIVDILWEDAKLFVWVESDWTTRLRKNKDNVYSDIERKYIFWNLKSVDHSFISFSNGEKRPYWSTQYLQPDLLVSHEEYFPNMEWSEEVRGKTAEWWWGFHVVKNTDTLEDSGYKFRDELGRSTTNTIKQIFSLYLDNPKYNERLTD